MRRQRSHGSGRRAMNPIGVGRGSPKQACSRRKRNRGSERFDAPTKTTGVGLLGSTSTGRPKRSSTESTGG
ncbi:hypothetical protein MUK42_01183 [Musa troglodytarum]|uniref:Uncharacterized protein n=1 Tax=Musa troglodytarum TaxID=320322 RepID=A0A9E7FBL1_9LILI|nr:hypothetical protein MUK42_01183 [Musa troglodytarum]